VRWLELARIRWLSEQNRPYPEYIAAGRHFAVIRLETQRGLVARAATERAMVDEAGCPRRIPREEREVLARLCGGV
jgi:acyl-CoA thioesterase FadM